MLIPTLNPHPEPAYQIKEGEDLENVDQVFSNLSMNDWPERYGFELTNKALSSALLKEVKNPCDIIVLADSSGSIGKPNHDLIKEFLRNFVSTVMQNSESRVHLAQFSCTCSVEVTLTAGVSDLLNAINSMKYHNGGTNLSAGMNHAHEVLSAANIGRNNSRRNLMIILTDGQPTCNRETPLICANEMIESFQSKIIVIGIGSSLDEHYCRQLCTQGYYFHVQSFKELSKLLSDEFGNLPPQGQALRGPVLDITFTQLDTPAYIGQNIQMKMMVHNIGTETLPASTRFEFTTSTYFRPVNVMSGRPIEPNAMEEILITFIPKPNITIYELEEHLKFSVVSHCNDQGDYPAADIVQRQDSVQLRIENFSAGLLRHFKKNRRYRILVVGPAGSGKSESMNTFSTMCCNDRVKTVKVGPDSGHCTMRVEAFQSSDLTLDEHDFLTVLPLDWVDTFGLDDDNIEQFLNIILPIAISGRIPDEGIGKDFTLEDISSLPTVPDDVAAKRRVLVCLGIISYEHLDQANKIDQLRRVLQLAKVRGVDTKVLITHADMIDEECPEDVRARIAEELSLNRRDVYFRINYCDNSDEKFMSKNFEIDKVSYKIMDDLLQCAAICARRNKL